jgi:hypothetical protein
MTIIKLLGSIPQLLGLIGSLLKALRDMQTAQTVAKVKDAIKKDDHVTLEKELGSSHAGEPTQHNIPELRTRPTKDRN